MLTPSKIVKLTTTFHIEGQANDLSAVEIVNCDRVYDVDLTVPPKSTKVFPLEIDPALTVGLFAVPNAQVGVTLGAHSRQLDVCEPLIWTKPSGLASPVPKGSKEIRVVNTSDQPATVYVRVMEINEAPAPAAAKPAEAKS